MRTPGHAFAVLVLVWWLSSPVASQSWIRSPLNGHDYHLTSPMNWHSARAEALRLGGELVTIRNQAEHDWLYSVFGVINMWTGFTDEGQEGRWRWISGEPVTFTSWGAGEPNNLGGAENWMQLTTHRSWNDNSNFAFQAVVERKPRLTTFPLDAVGAEGTAGWPGYFAVPRSRTQTIMMADGFSSRAPGSVAALSWRRDRGRNTYAARRADLAVRLGTPRTNPYGMSTTFADNHAGTLHEGFRGLFDVPQAPPQLVGPAPFLVRLPLSAPWAWNGGDLVLEVEVFSNTVVGIGTWEVDMQARQRGAGTVVVRGTTCGAPWGTPLVQQPDPRLLVPGGRIDQRLTNAPPGRLAAAWFGNRTDEWNGIPLPFTFPGTSCRVYTNNIAGVILPVVGDGATPLLSVPLPPDAIIHGLTVYSQWGVLEAGYPPITTTHALELTAAAAPSIWFDSIANLDGSATGIRSAEAYAAPVVQLELR